MSAMMVTAVLVGLAGSLHCVGMCSPLALAVSGVSRSGWLARILYNSGRILTYGILGAFVGELGAIAGLTDWQTLLSVLLGLLLILLGMSGVQALRIPLITPAMYRFTAWLKVLFARQLQSNNRKVSIFILGGLNGLLPCGLTYFALTYCITLPNANQGFMFMILFGAGTLPAMLGLPSLLHSLATRTRLRIQKLSAVWLIALGALLLIRSAYFYQREMNGSVEQANEVVCP